MNTVALVLMVVAMLSSILSAEDSSGGEMVKEEEEGNRIDSLQSESDAMGYMLHLYDKMHDAEPLGGQGDDEGPRVNIYSLEANGITGLI